MFDLIINLGTKEFLRSYINQNSLFAYNIQHHQDYVLLQFNQSPQLQAASCWKLIKQAPHLPIMKNEFYLIYLNLNLDNQKLLISQQSRLPSQASLYQRTNYQQVLLLTADKSILEKVADILLLTVEQLQAAVIHYHLDNEIKS